MNLVKVPIERLEPGARALAYKAVALRKESFVAHARCNECNDQLRKIYGFNFNAMKTDPLENIRARAEEIMNDSHAACFELLREIKERFDVDYEMPNEDGAFLIRNGVDLINFLVWK